MSGLQRKFDGNVQCENVVVAVAVTMQELRKQCQMVAVMAPCVMRMRRYGKNDAENMPFPAGR